MPRRPEPGQRLTILRAGLNRKNSVNVTAMDQISALAPPARPHPIRAALSRTQSQPAARRDDGDVKLFVVSFTAFFICFYTFFL